jgi:hypothetical protein
MGVERGWGHNDIQINNFNNFNRNANINANRAGNINANRSGSWQHNAAHRGGAPYRDRATANRYGGTARGDSLANRQAGRATAGVGQGGNVRSGAVGTAGELAAWRSCRCRRRQPGDSRRQPRKPWRRRRWATLAVRAGGW